MRYPDSLRLQLIRNQGSMTTPPDCLGAHDRRSFFCRAFIQLSQSFLELHRLHGIGITSKRRVAPPDVHGISPRDTPAAQCFKMAVVDSRAPQGKSKIGFVKLRISAGAWESPDVQNQFNAIRVEDPDQFFDSARRMSNRPNLLRGHGGNFNRNQVGRKALQLPHRGDPST